MTDVWFTSDQHFGHANIIDHCDRPCEDLEAMEDLLVTRWNYWVKPSDVVVQLGDFYWNGKYDQVLDWADRTLNGTIIFVKGNHDRWFYKKKRYMYNKKIAGIICWCGHYPLLRWPSGINLHGHSHGQLEVDLPNQFDVGVDVWNYRPVNIEEIKPLIDYDKLTRKQRGEIK